MNIFNLSLTCLRGENTGRIKDLDGFDKTHHRLSGADPAAAERIVSMLGAAKIEREGQEIFQQIRAALGYKRRDIAFSREGSTGVIACTDFELTLNILPHPENLRDYVLEKTLSQLREANVLHNLAFNRTFEKTFHAYSVKMEQPIDVEKWIDNIEDKDLEKELELIYPPDCTFCEMRLPRSDFVVRITKEAITISRPVTTPPSKLHEAFLSFHEKIESSL